VCEIAVGAMVSALLQCKCSGVHATLGFIMQCFSPCTSRARRRAERGPGPCLPVRRTAAQKGVPSLVAPPTESLRPTSEVHWPSLVGDLHSAVCHPYARQRESPSQRCQWRQHSNRPSTERNTQQGLPSTDAYACSAWPWLLLCCEHTQRPTSWPLRVRVANPHLLPCPI